MKRRRKGFALFAVVVLLAVMTAAAAIALDEAVASLQSSAQVRAAHLVKSAADYGLNVAMLHVAQVDVDTLIGQAADLDLFEEAGMAPTGAAAVSAGGNGAAGASPLAELVGVTGPITYPAAPSPYEGDLLIRMGARPGQRTRAPAGEDVRTAYGQVVEIQLSIEANPASTLPPVEERVAVGVVVPRTVAHAP